MPVNLSDIVNYILMKVGAEYYSFSSLRGAWEMRDMNFNNPFFNQTITV